MTPRLPDTDFDAVRAHLLDTAGLAFDESRRGGLEALMADRLHAHGLRGPGAVRAYLATLRGANGEAERQVLLDAATVQETHFFRNAPQMDALRRKVLPELLRRAFARGRPLTIWSAGCSTGEEPYTLAMMLLELVPALAPGLPVRVVGSDVSATALQAARNGTYAGRTLGQVPPGGLERWFEPAPGGMLAVSAPVRDVVDLRLHNLVAEAPPFRRGEVDLVVCRNVTIYFSRSATAGVVSTFRSILSEGGYLLLGHAETLWQASDGYTLVPVGDAYVYRRSIQPRASAAPTPRQPVVARTEPALYTAAQQEPIEGCYLAAAGAAEAAIRADPLHAPSYLLLGTALCALGRDAAAVDPLRKAVYLDPGDAPAHFLLAGALARLGRHRAATASYRAAAARLDQLGPEARKDLLGGRRAAELAQLAEHLALTAGAQAQALAGMASVRPGALGES